MYSTGGVAPPTNNLYSNSLLPFLLPFLLQPLRMSYSYAEPSLTGIQKRAINQSDSDPAVPPFSPSTSAICFRRKRKKMTFSSNRHGGRGLPPEPYQAVVQSGYPFSGDEVASSPPIFPCSRTQHNGTVLWICRRMENGVTLMVRADIGDAKSHWSKLYDLHSE